MNRSESKIIFQKFAYLRFFRVNRSNRVNGFYTARLKGAAHDEQVYFPDFAKAFTFGLRK